MKPQKRNKLKLRRINSMILETSHKIDETMTIETTCNKWGKWSMFLIVASHSETKRGLLALQMLRLLAIKKKLKPKKS